MSGLLKAPQLCAWSELGEKRPMAVGTDGKYLIVNDKDGRSWKDPELLFNPLQFIKTKHQLEMFNRVGFVHWLYSRIVFMAASLDIDTKELVMEKDGTPVAKDFAGKASYIMKQKRNDLYLDSKEEPSLSVGTYEPPVQKAKTSNFCSVLLVGDDFPDAIGMSNFGRIGLVHTDGSSLEKEDEDSRNSVDLYSAEILKEVDERLAWGYVAARLYLEVACRFPTGEGYSSRINQLIEETAKDICTYHSK